MFPKLMMTCSPGRSKWKRAAFSVVAVTAIGLVAAACGSSSKHSVSSAASASAANSGNPIVVAMDSSRYGVILTTPSGFALYTYTADDPGGPGCTGACLKFWPPLLLPAGTSQPVAGPGVTGLGTFARDGRLQVTFKGLPLYTYVSDKSPGQITGENVVDAGGKWLLAIVTPATASPASTTPAPARTTPATAVTTPATVPSVQQPPVTQAPAVTAPPATGPPMTSPPITNPPVTSPPPTVPTTSPPTTAPPLPSY